MGICGARTRQAERMLCLAGASWSFANASRYLRELSGLSVSASSVRQVCQQEAPRIDAWQATPAAAEKYRTSRGHDEFQTDGTCVNTDQGWKEMRVGVFAKRMPGAAAAPHEWATRKLPAPAARVAFAALEDHRTFAARWPVVASRLGIRAGAQLDVLADGARWIWERVDFHFAFAQGTLDIYHALEHVGQTAQALFGEGTTEAARWQAGARDALWGEGWPGIQRVIDPARVVAVGAAATHRGASLGRLLASACPTLGLSKTPGLWPAHRQRLHRRGLQKLSGTTTQTNRRPLAYSQRKSDGNLRLLGLRRPMDRLLG